MRPHFVNGISKMNIRLEQYHNGTWRARFNDGASERISPAYPTRSEALQWAADYFHTPVRKSASGGASIWL